MVTLAHARGSKGPKRISGTGSKNFNGPAKAGAVLKNPIKVMGDSEERRNSVSNKTSSHGMSRKGY